MFDKVIVDESIPAGDNLDVTIDWAKKLPADSLKNFWVKFILVWNWENSLNLTYLL